MDKEILKSIADCKNCPIDAWYDPPGECRRGRKECPLNIRRPQQQIADMVYEVIG